MIFVRIQYKKVVEKHSSKIKKSFCFLVTLSEFSQIQIKRYHRHSYKRLNFQRIGLIKILTRRAPKIGP